jgi:hypothetical protein
MIVDIVDKYCTNDNNPIKNLRLKGSTFRVCCLYSSFVHGLRPLLTVHVQCNIDDAVFEVNCNK